MNVKELLLKETHEAFSANEEMSLMASIQRLTQEEASWRLNDTTWTIEEILYHVASCKIEYCKQGFGKWDGNYDKPLGEVHRAIELLDRAHEHLVQCLLECREEDLDAPIPTRPHGESAAHFFWIMIMHDICHAAQIRTIQRAYGSRTGGFYPV